MAKIFFAWPEKLRRRIERLNSPYKIQQFLDSCSYNTDAVTRSPDQVFSCKRAHCFDGAVFAASVFAYHQEPPLILDLCAVRDDDHILAIYRQNGRYGAVGKSRYVGLRFREAIFKNPRELALSYFECYFNLRKEKTLRSYSHPVNLSTVPQLSWQMKDPFEHIAEHLTTVRHYPILPAEPLRAISRVDHYTFSSGRIR